ncbi:MAG: NAD(P)H-dependent oxidoreductase subunit E [Candidatus Bathyarchaeia archaeon]
MVLLICQHCDYRWDYQGENEHYATCPTCRYKVRIPEEKAQMLRRKGLDMELKSKFSLKEQHVKLRGIAGIVNKTIEDYQYDKSMLIQILLRLQKNFGWLPMEMLLEVSKQLGIPINQVYQVATFYKAFSLSPRGRHLIRVCTGTSCKVRGAPIILEKLQSFLDIDTGEVTPDGRFSLETVNCLGCCALGPMMTIDGEYYGNLKLLAVKRILSKYT